MEQQNLTKKYGLLTAISLVVGAVIGSGIFFQNEFVFAATGGDLALAVIAWLIGGAIMFVMMWVWGTLARNKEGMNGLMDYSDNLIGRKYSYFLTWFLGTILYPSFAAILAWVSARFVATFLGWSQPNTSGPVWMLAGVFLIGIYVMNVISPKLAGHFQVSTTFIKVIPLILMGVVGLIVGLTNGTVEANMATMVVQPTNVNPLYAAILYTVFAYAGSEEVLMMNSEIKDAKKNLPRGIIIGAIIIIAIYVIYTIGVFGSAEVETLATAGGVRIGFANIFGGTFGNILTIFIIISCLGAMNSAMMAGSRAFYSIALRNMGPSPEHVKTVDAKTNMPPTSAAISLLFCGLMMFIIFANAGDVGYHVRWFGDVNFAITSLAPITLMGFYVPIFASVMIKEKSWNAFNRFVMPALSIAGALLLMYMVWDTNPIGVLWYLAFFGGLMAIAAIFLIFNKTEKE